MLIVMDTSVLVAAVRSSAGASAELVRMVLNQQIKLAASVPLFLEYEAVLLRPEQLQAANAREDDVLNLLNVLAGLIKPVEIQFLWRPQLRDAADDMVLEAAVNGQASTLVTFNTRDFLPQALSFGLAVYQPGVFLSNLRSGVFQ